MPLRKSYPEAFKREAVQLAKERGNLSAAARDLGISDNTLHNWKKQHDQLQRELRRLQEENAILKKAVGIFVVDRQ